MRLVRNLVRARSGSAAAELALVTPLLLALMFASVEGGNYFWNEHALVKSVRDGARYGARLPITTNYTCPDEIESAARDDIVKLTKTGLLTTDAVADARRPYAAADPCDQGGEQVTVTVRCADADTYPGMWRELGSDIPIVKVSAAVRYQSVLEELGFATDDLCLRAESEAPVIGL